MKRIAISRNLEKRCKIRFLIVLDQRGGNISFCWANLKNTGKLRRDSEFSVSAQEDWNCSNN